MFIIIYTSYTEQNQLRTLIQIFVFGYILVVPITGK